MSVAQANASAWTQSYRYDQYNRLTNVTSLAGHFGYSYPTAMSDRVRKLGLPGEGTEHTYIDNEFDELARLTGTTLYKAGGMVILNQHTYQYNAANERTRQTFKDGNYVDYTYDPIGQLKTAKGWESGGGTNRLHEQFGYAYDKAWNLNYRTNNALLQTFNVNNLNELTSGSRDGTFTVAGTATERKAVSAGGRGVTNVTVSGTGLSSGSADVYADGSWARTNAILTSGINSYTATAQDFDGRTSQDNVSVNLPASPTFAYDANGNLTNDSQRILEYDFENQLTNVYVANGWRSEFKYDAFGRRRIRKEYTWTGTWTLTNEVRYVYDDRLVVQERDGNNLADVTYTRGNDLSGDLQKAGGIGGLLARTDAAGHAYYQSDGNGNVTTLVNTNGVIVARYNYDPYGNVLAISGPLAEANLYRFSTKEFHPPSGLAYYLHRCYDPNLQRWLNRDPIEEAGGINLYEYNFSSPINWGEPFGLEPFDKFASCDAAAKDAMQYLHDNPKKENGQHYEQSAALFQDAKDSKFYYNYPENKSGFPGRSTPDYNFKLDEKDKLAGIVHDHIKSEDFSSAKDDPKGVPKDIELYKDKQVPGYLKTPKGVMKKYDPKTGNVTNIGTCK